jgi:2-polyprenyl-3-methyl-5-hydroxy-6-metoxy-1,4-benzoquinol methylase
MGCGEGINSNFLALTSDKRKIVGIEIDKKRVAIADKKIPNTSFDVGDATKSIPKADAIIFFHVLHHFNSYTEQEKVIENCYKALKKGGKLLIVEIDPKPSLKYWTCWVFDHFFVPWVFEGRFHSNAYFRKSKDWKKLIDNKGFKCTIRPAEAGRPFSNVILDSTRI